MKNQYIVMREWKTGKRTYKIATGPFSSRAKAKTFADRHRYMLDRESTIAVVLFRPRELQETPAMGNRLVAAHQP